MTKQGEKIRFKYEEENYYNSDFSQKLYIYLSENDDKTILDFIKNELDEISTKKKERARIFNLNDDDFYEYLIINNDRYKRIIEESIDKNETKILIIRNSLENEKSFFKDPTIFDRKEEFYKRKLLENQRSLKIEPKLKNKIQWKGTDLEFSELVKALYESNLISPELTQKECFSILKQAFGLTDFDQNDKLKQIRQRTKDKTKLINTLEINLNKWIEKND
jgi:hypothetical protein